MLQARHPTVLSFSVVSNLTFVLGRLRTGALAHGRQLKLADTNSCYTCMRVSRVNVAQRPSKTPSADAES